MNINYQSPINGWVLPDPWVKRVDPTPAEELEPYYRFVSANVQEHTSGNVQLTRSDQLAFLRFMATHGLRPADRRRDRQAARRRAALGLGGSGP